MQGDLLVSGSLASAKVLFPNKIPLTGSGAHRGMWVYFVGGLHAPHDTHSLTAPQREEPPCSQAPLDPPGDGLSRNPSLSVAPKGPRLPGSTARGRCVKGADGWEALGGDAGSVDALGAPGSMTRFFTRGAALAAKDDRSALPMEADAEGGVRFKRKTGSIILIWRQANPHPGWSAEAWPRHQLHASAPLGSQWATSVMPGCLGLPVGNDHHPGPSDLGTPVSRSLKDNCGTGGEDVSLTPERSARTSSARRESHLGIGAAQ